MHHTWIWLIVALLFFIGEMFTAGFFLVCFGLGALAASLAAYLHWGFPAELAGFALVSFFAFLFSRRFAEKVTGESPVGVGIDRVMGKTGVVIEAIDPIHATGMVRVEREEWRAVSEDETPIGLDEKVRVVGVDGTKLIVKKEG